MYLPVVKSFDENLYICESCHRHLNKNKIPCQAAYYDLVLDPIPNELHDFEKLEKNVNFQDNFV